MHAGFLLASSIAEEVASILMPLSPTLPVPVVTVSRKSVMASSSFRAASALARRLLWRRSVVVADSADAAADFGRAAKENDLCIVEEVIVQFRRSVTRNKT